MKTEEEKPLHVKPALYAFYYEILKDIAKRYGYNLLLHGSMNRDLDLVAIPWSDECGDEFEMIKKMAERLHGRNLNYKEQYNFSILPGNRHNYVIHLNRSRTWQHTLDGQYYLDISVVPTGQQVAAATADIKRERDEYYDTLQQHRIATAELQKRVEELEGQVPKWISMEERLPERAELTDDNLVLVDSCLYAGIMVCEYKGAKFIDPIDGSNITEYITRWMSIPQPLK